MEKKEILKSHRQLFSGLPSDFLKLYKKVYSVV